MSKPIKMADALMHTADAIVALGKKADINVDITRLYNKDTIKELALTTKFLMDLCNTASNPTSQIEVTKD